MLDVSRRHMNRNQIIACIRSIDQQKFQFVQLHLNDDESFAVKSNLLHNTNNKNTLSKRDLEKLFSILIGKKLQLFLILTFRS